MAALHFPEAIASLTLIEPVAFFLLRARSASDHALFTEITGVGDRIAKGLLSGDYRTALEQIGRASCRVRVCRYVYILVVAGSLKKKKRLDKRKYNRNK